MDLVVASRSVLPRGDVRISHRDAMQLIACPLRYVLDSGASRQCGDLLRDCPDLMMLESDVLRVPATEFWLEWPAEVSDDRAYDQRLGCLVRAAPDGRSGEIQAYHTNLDGQARRLPGTISFDLDGEFSNSVRGSRTYAHGLFPHLDDVLAKSLMTMDGSWIRANARDDERAFNRKMASEAEGTWFYLPFLLTFSVLLFSPNVLTERRARTGDEAAGLPNAAQRRTRKLEHIEVSLHLGEYSTGDRPGSSTDGKGSRDAPRLHLVRGHYVSRNQKTFWRTSHLRGSGDWAGCAKTVNVKAARKVSS